MSGEDIELTTLTRSQGANRALKDGVVKPDGFSLVFEEIPVLVRGFRAMVRGLEFDVAEMALTTYLTAREHGVAFTALPVFLVRGFHHGAILVKRNSDVRTPRDLEGRRVGVNRGYTVTTGVWARGILQSEYGVDLDRVTWVLSGDEHVASYVPPANVVPAGPDGDLASMLVGGELDAVIGAEIDHPDVTTLIPDADAAAMAALRERALYPINHLIVVKDEVIQRFPHVTTAVFDAFDKAKELYVQRLSAGVVSTAKEDRMYADVLRETGEDPLPYGIAPNRAMLEKLLDFARVQHILSKPVDIDDLFAG